MTWRTYIAVCLWRSVAAFQAQLARKWRKLVSIMCAAERVDGVAVVRHSTLRLLVILSCVASCLLSSAPLIFCNFSLFVWSVFSLSVQLFCFCRCSYFRYTGLESQNLSSTDVVTPIESYHYVRHFFCCQTKSVRVPCLLSNGTEHVLCLPHYYLITGIVRLCKTLQCLYLVSCIGIGGCIR